MDGKLCHGLRAVFLFPKISGEERKTSKRPSVTCEWRRREQLIAQTSEDEGKERL